MAFVIFIKPLPLEYLARVAFGFLALGLTAAASWAAAGAVAFLRQDAQISAFSWRTDRAIFTR